MSEEITIDSLRVQLAKATRERDELKKEIERLKEEIEGWYAYKRNIDEALNSGDGVYRP